MPAGSVRRPAARFIRTMYWLWGLAGAAGVALALAAFFAVRATRRLGAWSARNVETDPQADDAGSCLPACPTAAVCWNASKRPSTARRTAHRSLRLARHRRLSRHQRHARPRRGRHACSPISPSGSNPACRPAQCSDASRTTNSRSWSPATTRNAEPNSPIRFPLRLAEPIFMDQMWQISASIGIALAPEDGTTGDELARHAALALRAAKHAGRGSVRRFAPQIHQEHAERRFFLRELESAIDEEGFRRALPAGGRRRGRRHCRRRSAGALDPSDARADRAVGIHSARRGERTDEPARRDRVAARARRWRALAEPVRVRQPVAGADAQPRPRRTDAPR